MEDWQAHALASFCRRSTFEQYLVCSDNGEDKDEAYAMISAIHIIRAELNRMRFY
jgi:hypothetical protein